MGTFDEIKKEFKKERARIKREVKPHVFEEILVEMDIQKNRNKIVLCGRINAKVRSSDVIKQQLDGKFIRVGER